MRPIKPIFIERNNKREKVVAVVFLLVFSVVVLLASQVKGQAPYKGDVLKSTTANAECANNTAVIRWNVAMDGRYRFFIIERTRDKVHYEFVSMVKTTDSKNNATFYTAVDYNTLAGNVFYRISATDLSNQPVRLFEVPFSTSSTASIH
jgi:hypothetical protein